MQYHKIYRVPLEICTQEQKIAYNLAFYWLGTIQRKLSGFPDDDRDAIMRGSIAVTAQAMTRDFCKSYPNSRANPDGIQSALNAGLYGYLKNPRIAATYEEIGKMFPAHYL